MSIEGDFFYSNPPAREFAPVSSPSTTMYTVILQGTEILHAIIHGIYIIKGEVQGCFVNFSLN